MNWPLVSRRAYDLLAHQMQRLEAQNDKLIEDLTRQSRFEKGMAETPRPERKQLEPMPRDLHDWIRGWANPATQKMQRAQAYRRHGRGEDWATIMDEMMQEDEAEVVPD